MATRRSGSPPFSLKLLSSAVNAALYTTLGVFSASLPTFFGVRIWPQVFVPATFAVIFGPWPGGVGAAIGIFLSDVLFGHHDALLSLLVGVPSNFVGFFLIGWLTNTVTTGGRRATFFVSLLFPIALAGYGIYLSRQLLYAIVGVIAIIAIIGFAILKNRWATFEIAASIGLGAGSLIIGFGLVAYSSLFTLPAALHLGTGQLPLAFAYGATTFTYLSEILPLLILTPPIVAACRAALPTLVAGPRKVSK